MMGMIDITDKTATKRSAEASGSIRLSKKAFQAIAKNINPKGDVLAVAEIAGIKKLFHRVAIKPGKPIWCGYKGKILVIGLPGNPLSSYIGWNFFVNPYIRKVNFMPDVSIRELTLLSEVNKPEHLHCFYKAKTHGDGVRILKEQESYKISPLLNSDCFVALPEGKSVFKKGEMAQVYDL